MREKGKKQDEQTLVGLNSAQCHSQSNWNVKLAQTSYIKRIKCVCVCRHIINILLTQLSRSVCMGES